MICTLFTGQTSKEGIFMKYSYEFKKECVQLYREGRWADTPEGVKEKRFHDTIKEWFKLEEKHGPEILKHGNNIEWTTDEKLEVVSKVLADAKLEVDQARVDAYIDDMASSYEDPTEVIEYFKNDKQQRSQIEAVVLEDQVVDHILASAKVTDTAVSYEDLLKEQQARQQG